jgi:urease accessory protein
MLEIRERVDALLARGTVRAEEERAQLTLTLPFDSRQRSRLRVTLSNGEVAMLALPRGSVLRGGDLLRISDERVARVISARERVSTARSNVLRALLRAAYHLGNRHVPLEIGEGYLRYLHDHVLDGMVRDLGLSVNEEEAAFEPEAGAYARGHDHGHGHGHGSRVVDFQVGGRDD